MNRRRARGFTLIEVMIVVVIVAILAAVAVPSYQNQIQKTRRADAKEALTRAAAAQERWFFSNNRYTNDLEKLGFDEDGTSTDGHYEMVVVVGDPPTTYTITATPVAGKSQENDSACSAFVINQAGLKTATKDGGDDNTATCWR